MSLRLGERSHCTPGPVWELRKLRTEVDIASNLFAHIIWKICALDYLICAPKTILNCNNLIAISTPANGLKSSAYITWQPRHAGRGVNFTSSLRGVRGFCSATLGVALRELHDRFKRIPLQQAQHSVCQL